MTTQSTDGRRTRSAGSRRATSSGRRPSTSAEVETTDAILAEAPGPQAGTGHPGATASDLGTAATGRTAPGTPTAETRAIGSRSASSVRNRTTVHNGTARPEMAGEPTAGNPRAAADHAERRNSVQLHVPLVGTVSLPATDELAYLGGVGALALVGVIEWPVAVVLGAGHALVAKHRGKVLREFGEALEEA